MYEYVVIIPEYINVLKDTRKRLERAAMTIIDDQVMAIASRSLLDISDYNIECKQWNKFTIDLRTWFAWKTTFHDANYAHI